MKKIVAKFAFLILLAVGTVSASQGAFSQSNETNACPYRDPHSCCVYYCMHDSTCNPNTDC